MPEMTVQTPPTATQFNGVVALTLEARLRYFFSEQARLRELLDRTRADLDRINAELLRFQGEFCTDQARDAEYTRCIERLLGTDLTYDPKELDAARTDGETVRRLLQELSGANDVPSPGAVR